jgi:phospholipid/cholesterol/gamma-HCH transport system substrate-binding protein
MKLLQLVLDDTNRQAIDQGLQDLSSTMNNINNASEDLEQLIAQEKTRLSAIITNLNQMSINLNQFSDSLSDLELKKTMAEANKALTSVNEILKKINSGEGTMGQLVNNDTLYNNLESASKSLDKLLIDLEANPKRYVHFSVFGRKDKSESQGEE